MYIVKMKAKFHFFWKKFFIEIFW